MENDKTHTLNIIRLVNNTLIFHGFDGLRGKEILFRHTGENSVILIPKDEVDSLSGKVYFRLNEDKVTDTEIINLFRSHDAINNLFIKLENDYYQTQEKVAE